MGYLGKTWARPVEPVICMWCGKEIDLNERDGEWYHVASGQAYCGR